MNPPESAYHARLVSSLGENGENSITDLAQTAHLKQSQLGAAPQLRHQTAFENDNHADCFRPHSAPHQCAADTTTTKHETPLYNANNKSLDSLSTLSTALETTPTTQRLDRRGSVASRSERQSKKTRIVIRKFQKLDQSQLTSTPAPDVKIGQRVAYKEYYGNEFGTIRWIGKCAPPGGTLFCPFVPFILSELQLINLFSNIPRPSAADLRRLDGGRRVRQRHWRRRRFA